MARLYPDTLDADALTLELLSSAWAQCETLCYHVYLPLLNAAQTDGSDEAGTAEIKRALDAYHRFLAALQVTSGRVQGTVVLPMPHNRNWLAKERCGSRMGRESHPTSRRQSLLKPTSNGSVSKVGLS